MKTRKRIFSLIGIMTFAVLFVGGISVCILYRVALEEEQIHLLGEVQSQARLIEAVARFDEAYVQRDHPQGAHAATLSQIKDALEHYSGIGRTGEFTVARLRGGDIEYIFRQRQEVIDDPIVIPLDSDIAEPMRLALTGMSGSMIGLDYRGVRVLAAYEPVDILDLGIVAKMDLAEVNAPFIRAGVIGISIAIIVIAAGVYSFYAISDPLVRQLEKSHLGLEKQIHQRNQELQQLNIELECRVNERTQELANANATIASLGSISAKIQAKLDLDQIIENVSAELIQMGLQNWIGLLDKESGDVVVRYTSIHSKTLAVAEKLVGKQMIGFRLPEATWPIYDRIINQGSGLFIEDLAPLMHPLMSAISEKLFRQALGIIGVTEDTRTIYMPLKTSDRVVGILGVWNGNLRKEDLPIFTIFSGQVAAAMETARLYAEAQYEIIERKKAEQLLRESEGRYRNLFNSGSDAIFVYHLTEDGSPDSFDEVNDAACQRLGYTREELLTRSVFDITPDIQMATVKNNIEMLLKEESTTFENYHVAENSKQIPVEVSSHLFDYHGKRTVLSIARDITDRKLDEQELTIYREHLEDLVEERTAELQSASQKLEQEMIERSRVEAERNRLYDMPGILIMIARSDSTILRVSSGWQDIFGYSVEEMAGNSFQDFIHPDDIPESDEENQQMVGGKMIQYFENRYRHKDGTYRTLAWAASADPETGLHYGVAQDITEAKQAEEALRHSEKNLAEAQRIAHVGNWIWEIPEDRLVWSDEVYRIFGLDPQKCQASYRIYLKRVHQDDRREVATILNDAVTNKTSFKIEHRVIRPNGAERCVYGQGEVVTNNLGEPYRVIGIVQDITERKLAEEEIHRRQQEQMALNRLLQLALEDISIENQLYRTIDILLDLSWLALIPKVGIFLIEDNPRKMVLKAQRNFPTAQVEICGKIEAGQCVCGRTLENGGTMFVDRIDERHNRHYPDMVPHGHYSVPIKTGEAVIGVLVVYVEDGHSRSQHEEDFLNAVAGILANSIQRKQGQDILMKLSRVVDQAADLVLITDLAGTIEYVNPAFRSLTGFSQEEALGNKPSILNSGQYDDVFFQNLWETILSGEIYQDVMINQKKNGELYHEEKTITPLKDAHGDITHFVSTGRDITERIIAQNEIQRRASNLQALHAIDVAISTSLDLRVTLDILLSQLISQLGVDAADVLLLDSDAKTLDYAAQQGFRTTALRHTHLKLGDGYAGQAALERSVVHIPDIRTTKPGFYRSPLIENEKFIAYYGVPLIVKDQIVGVLEIFHRTPHASDTEWMDLLDALATQAAIAIENANLFEELQHANTELTLAYDKTLEGWALALELRDEETEGHTRRVTDLTVRLAQEFGISKKEIVQIRRGALLHDIGKMGIPDRILHKPGKLTDEEWVIMRQHTTYAYEMLSKIPFLKPALEIPYCHHEKWDGTGYPRGLQGEEIPLAARIFAIVDVWDALRSDRPYRKAWPDEKVLGYLREQVGSHFEPKVYDVFMKVITEIS